MYTSLRIPQFIALVPVGCQSSRVHGCTRRCFLSTPTPRLPPTPGPLQSRRHASGRRRRLPLPRRRGVQPRASAPAGEAPRRPRRRLPSRLQVQARPAALQGAITWPLLVQQQCTVYGFRFRAGLSPLRSLNWGSDNSLNEHGLLAGLECELLLCAFRSHVVGYWGVEATAL